MSGVANLLTLRFRFRPAAFFFLRRDFFFELGKLLCFYGWPPRWIDTLTHRKEEVLQHSIHTKTDRRGGIYECMRSWVDNLRLRSCVLWLMGWCGT